MIDCGIPFSKMKEDLYKVDTLLLTHSHSDHIKPETLEHIRESFPRVKVYGNSDVAYQYQVDRVVGSAPIKLKRQRVVIPFECKHDVECTGYIIQFGELNVLYATDTCEIHMPVEMQLDYVFLESNYDERKLKQMAKQYKHRGYDPVLNAHRHLSTQKCKEFYFLNRRSADSVLVELHQSKRFY